MVILNIHRIVGKNYTESHDCFFEFLEQNDILPLAYTNTQLILTDEDAVVYNLKGLEQAYEQLHPLEAIPW